MKVPATPRIQEFAKAKEPVKPKIRADRFTWGEDDIVVNEE